MKYMDLHPDLSSSHPDAYQDLLCCQKMPVVYNAVCVFFLLLDIEEKWSFKCTCEKKMCLYDRCVKSYATNWKRCESLDAAIGSLPVEVQNDLRKAALDFARSLS
mmetsp:Transcript_3869/g.5605  ORF Transcript_3869/g.5605 Transcript_3869/m.5605 type:complete len:105 (+) Transcript_3869:592-906(+)